MVDTSNDDQRPLLIMKTGRAQGKDLNLSLLHTNSFTRLHIICGGAIYRVNGGLSWLCVVV